MASYNRFFINSALALGVAAAMLLNSSITHAQDDNEDVVPQEGSGVSAGAVATQDSENDRNTLEEVVVSGIRSAQERAIDIKRNAGSIVDSITATDIGKLPDVTIADSLQRVPGVQIQRSGGEGDVINIRGVAQVMTTLNGEQMLSAGSITTVQPNYADIPSTLLNGVDVFKSTEAKLLNGGISGVVNLKTYRPFLLDDGLTVIGKAEITDGSMGSETDSNLMAFVGYNADDRWGVTLNLSVSESNLANYRIGHAGDDWAFMASEASSFVQDNIDINGDGDFNDVYYAFQGHQAANEYIVRDRVGVNMAFQMNLTDALSLTAEGFYTNMEEHQNRAAFDASQSWQGVTGWFTPTQMTAHENIIIDTNGQPVLLPGNLYSVQAAELQARRVMTHSEANNYDRESLNTNIELSFDDGGAFRASVRWVTGEARNDRASGFVDAYMNSGEQTGNQYLDYGGVPISNVNPWGYDGSLATLPDGTEVVGSYTQIPIGIQYTGSGQVWTLPTMNSVNGSPVNEVFGSNINRYSLTSAWYTGANQYAEMDIFRADFSYDLNLGPATKLDFGIRRGVREVEQDDYTGVGIFTNGFGDPFIAQWKDSAIGAPLTGESYIPPISFTDPRLQGSVVQISDFQGASGLGSLWFIDPKAMYNPRAFHTALYGQQAEVLNPERTYRLKESMNSLYAQLDFEGDLLGRGYSGNFGIRYVKTEFDMVQYEIGTDNFNTINGVDYIRASGPSPVAGTVNVNREYSDTLPSLNISYDLTDEQKMRFSYSKAVTTHDAQNLAGGLSVNRILACNVTDANNSPVFCATGGNALGNPELDPWRSDNYDLTYEWYFSDSGLLAIGLFYIDIESFITQTTVFRDDIPDSDGVVRGYDVASQQFTGLVPITTIANSDSGASIKGLEIGYKHAFDFFDNWMNGFGVDANYTYSPSDSGQFDYYGNENTLPDNSKTQTNLAVWYDKHNWEARIAANQRSKIYRFNTTPDGQHQFAKYRKPTTYIDASVAYHLGDNLTFSLLVTNLTEEYIEEYYQWSDAFSARFINERRVMLGVQYRL